MAVTLTTEWQEVTVVQKYFSSTNWIKYHVDAKVGSPNVTKGTIPIYTRLRSSVNYTGWSANGYKWALTYAQHTTSSETWEGSDTWYFDTETILETLTATDIKYDADGTKTVTLNAVCQNNYHTQVSTTFSVDVALPTITTYYLDVNGRLDGSSVGNVSGYGYFDVYINGSADRTGVADYNRAWIGSTTYEIKNIKATTGHTYNGVYSGSLSGTISAATTVALNFTTNSYSITYNLDGGTNNSSNPSSAKYGTTVTLANPTKTGYTFTGWSCSGGTLSGSTLTMGASNVTLTAKWTVNTYTNNINHYAGGFKNGEGTNASGNLYHLADTTFTATYGSTITYDSSKCTTIPNGYAFSAMGSSSFASSWTDYPIGQQLTQLAKVCHMQYDYYPYKYDITYNLNGGTNHADNPSTYTVLYGVTFKEPTREGYTFKGWTTADGTPITGINEGKNATFSSASDLYTQLASRTIGGVTVYANWESNQATMYTKVNGDWVKGKVFVKKDGTWIKASKVYTKVNGQWVESVTS